MRAALAAGALFLLLPPGVGPAQRTVVLTTHHSRFSPARLQVPAGATVRFVVRNDDPIDHELIVGDDAAHRRHELGRERHHHGDVAGEVSVPAGATATTTYRFTGDRRVTFGCHLPGHWAYGMRGLILVGSATSGTGVVGHTLATTAATPRPRRPPNTTSVGW